MSNEKKKDVVFPVNWDEVVSKIDSGKLKVKDGIDALGITKGAYYALRKAAKEVLEEKEPEDAETLLEKKEELTPMEYFHQLKDSKQVVDSSELKASYVAAEEMYTAFWESGQVKAANKLTAFMETIVLENRLVELGVDTFVYRQDIERFISNVEKKVVKIIELENYERPIPEEVQEVIKLANGIFTDRLIVFTDYTGKVEKRVEKERRDKDPILFGVFRDKDNYPLSDRFYFLGDWEDEYCDLRLESVVEEMRNKTGETITHTISEIPTTKGELQKRLDNLRTKEEDAEYEDPEPESSLGSPKLDSDDSRTIREVNEGESLTLKKKIFQKVSTILGKRKK